MKYKGIHLTDSQDIEYTRHKNVVFTKIIYPCGCEWEVAWEDISKGQIRNIATEVFCEAHDPTLPFCEKDDSDE